MTLEVCLILNAVSQNGSLFVGVVSLIVFRNRLINNKLGGIR